MICENLKLMIVDDEPLMRRGFTVILDWDEYGFIGIEEADNAFAALEKAVVYTPDIVVTDIRMPEMDGIEMVSNMKRILPDSKFIIVSGHDDFAYAKRAMSLGIESYLVKPIRRPELGAAIEKCIAQIALEREEKRRKEITSLYLRDNLIYRLLHGLDTGGQAASRILTEAGVELDEGQYQPIALKLLAEAGYESVDIRDLANDINNRLREMTARVKAYVIPSGNGIDIMLTYVDGTDRLCAYSELMCAVEQACGRNDCAIAGCIGRVVDNLTELPSSYAQADSIAAYRAMSGQRGLLAHSDMAAENHADYVLFKHEDGEELSCAIAANKQAAIMTLMKRITSSLKQTSYLTLDAIYANMAFIMMTAYRVITESGGRTEIFCRDMFSLDYYRQCRDFEEMFALITEYLCSVASRLAQDDGMGSHGGIVNRMVRYVDENISQPLSLKKVADALHYNSSYLSRLFKKEQGMCFSEYLQQARISKAKRLLSSSDCSVIEVSERVGYRDYRHFLSVFKEIVGMTPFVYRLGEFV